MRPSVFSVMRAKVPRQPACTAATTRRARSTSRIGTQSAVCTAKITLGKLVIETGKGSFRLEQVYAAGDLVLVADSENRILLYSLKTGEQKGRVFGDFATVSPNGKLLCVTNESGKLNVYRLADMQSIEQFVFTSTVTAVEFSEDNKKLIVLTSNQTAHVFDISSL